MIATAFIEVPSRMPIIDENLSEIIIGNHYLFMD
jgi:hypothetical protein